MIPVQFRAAQRSDVTAIIAMLANDLRGRGREDASEPLDPRYLRAFEAIAAAPNSRLIVGELDGQVIACAQLTVTPGLSQRGALRATIESVQVLERQRSQGIGEQLLAHLVALAKAEGCGIVQLTTSKIREDAHRFYARIGFQNSHEGFKLELPV